MRFQAEQDLDVLTFHNERLTKLTQSLQAEMNALVRREAPRAPSARRGMAQHSPADARWSGPSPQNADRGGAWLGGISKKEHQRVKEELDVVRTDLNAKILENGSVTCRWAISVSCAG